MEFEPEYLKGILKVNIFTLFISLFPLYLTDNGTIIVGLSLVVFFVVLFLTNKKWIKSVKLDFENKKIDVKYPLSLFGTKKQEINFSDISKVTYFEYMSRTPAHFKINHSGKILRFNCNRMESKKISSLFKDVGIETNFHPKKEVGFR